MSGDRHPPASGVQPTYSPTGTMEPCPACETCAACQGTGKVWCHHCGPTPHALPCSFDAACGICGGTQQVTAERRRAWRYLRSEPPEAV